MRELIQCHLDDPKAENGKVGFARVPGDEEEGIKGACDVCGQELRYVKDNLYDILAVACRDCQHDWIPPIKYEPKAQAVTENDVCDECGGPRRGRGYSHEESCSAIKANKVVETCEECGGARRGRGFMHTDECPNRKVQPERKDLPTCEHCGGTKKGRGFSHAEDCPVLKEREQTKSSRKPKSRPKGRRPRL